MTKRNIKTTILFVYLPNFESERDFASLIDIYTLTLNNHAYSPPINSIYSGIKFYYIKTSNTLSSCIFITY